VSLTAKACEGRRPNVSVVACVMEEGRLRLQAELLGHRCETAAALIAPAKLDDGVVEDLRVDEVDVARLAEVDRHWQGISDRKVWHADPRERLEVAGRIMEDLSSLAG
jgi:hypothetical protein